MGKRLISAFLCMVSVFLFSCKENGVSTNHIEAEVNNNYDLIVSAVGEMEKLKLDRVYVRIEKISDEDENEQDVLVYYEKSSEEHTIFENEILKKIIEDFGLTLILHQATNDGRSCVIFAYSNENDSVGVAKGFYYSADGKPFAWWGRDAVLKKDHGRFIELNDKNMAWYSTVLIKDNVYYYEKKGSIGK